MVACKIARTLRYENGVIKIIKVYITSIFAILWSMLLNIIVSVHKYDSFLFAIFSVYWKLRKNAWMFFSVNSWRQNAPKLNIVAVQFHTIGSYWWCAIQPLAAEISQSNQQKFTILNTLPVFISKQNVHQTNKWSSLKKIKVSKKKVMPNQCETSKNSKQ